jgi:hypothetical protein
MPTTRTTTTETGDLVSRAREIEGLLATAASIHQNANVPGVIGDAREQALFGKLVRQLGDLALHETEAVLGEAVVYD